MAEQHTIHIRPGDRKCLILHDHKEEGSKDRGAGSRKRVKLDDTLRWYSHRGRATIDFANGTPLCQGPRHISHVDVPADGYSAAYTIDGNATLRYKYTITWNPHTPTEITEDPQVIIDSDRDLFNTALKAFGIGVVVAGAVLLLQSRQPSNR